MRHIVRILLLLAALFLFCLFASANEPSTAWPYWTEQEWAQVSVVVTEDGFTVITREYSDGSAESVCSYQQRIGPCEYVYVVNLSHGAETERVVLVENPAPAPRAQESEPTDFLLVGMQMSAALSEDRQAQEEPAETPPTDEPVAGSQAREEVPADSSEEKPPALRTNTLTYYSSDDRPLWSIQIDSTFCGDRCSGADGSLTIYDPAWENEVLLFTKNPDTGQAEVQCRMRRRALGIPVAKLNVHIRVDAEGRCITTVENR